jgi:hypothetical protein
MDAKAIAQICKLPEMSEVFYMIPVGKPTAETSLVPTIPGTAAFVPTVSAGDMRSKHIAIIVPSRYFNETDFYGIQQAFVKEGFIP